jgi:integrase
MPHHPKPWFRPSRNRWYVEIDGKQYNLGPDETQAFGRYHDLMRSRPREKADVSLAVGVLDAFLDWAKENKAARTYEWYQRHCEAFARSIPPLLSVGQLKKHHLTACLAKQKTLNSTTKNGLCRAVCRAFQWAENEEIILRSPFRGFEKPRHLRRNVVVSPEDFAFMRSFFPAECIRDLLVTAWETAARPQEIVAVEARHVDLANARWVFPAEESKGKQFPRIVYLNETAFEITRRLLLWHPAGPLFRNTDGRAWNRHSLNCVFGRLNIALGLRRMKELGIAVEKPPRFKRHAFPDQAALAAARAEQERKLYERRKELYKEARKHGRKYTLYHLRHSWATRALQRGLDPLTVSILLGHTDPSTLAKVYQHLALDPDFLRKAVKKATQPEAGDSGDAPQKESA